MPKGKESAKKEVLLLCDSLRDPRDLAQLIHLSLATNTKLELTGSSISPIHPKVIGIVNSWLPGFYAKPQLKLVSQKGDFFKRINELKKKGFVTVGTSSHEGESLFDKDLSKGKHAIVFGTETSGLSKEKMAAMDKMINVPMKNETKFFTLSAVVPLVTYELLRQKKLL